MNAPRYYSDVIKARRAQADAEAIRWAKHDAKQAAFKAAENLHPAIGVLMTAKGVKYYAYIDGQYTEGSVEALTAELMKDVRIKMDSVGRVWFTGEGCDTAIVVTKEPGPGGPMWVARLHDMADGSAVECDLKHYSMKSAMDAATKFMV